MANPQAEDGHIDIANEIAEALMRTNFSAYQTRILWAVWRKTYGWKKKEDWISNSQLVLMTGLKKGHVSRTKKELLTRNIIVTNSGNKLAFNKDYTQWRELPKGERGYQFGQKVTNSGKKVTNSGGHKRNLTKETLQKSSAFPKNAGDFYPTKKKRKLSGKRLETFNQFWDVFDYKRGRAEAADAWLDIPELTDPLVEKILAAAKIESINRQKKIDSGKTPKMAQGWISGRRWEDENVSASQRYSA